VRRLIGEQFAFSGEGQTLEVVPAADVAQSGAPESVRPEQVPNAALQLGQLRVSKLIDAGMGWDHTRYWASS